MPIYKDMNSLLNDINQRLAKVIDCLTQKVYQQLMDDIDVCIYSTYEPRQYKRTNEFRDKAWAKKSAENIAGIIMADVHYEPMNMRWDPSRYQHGNTKVDRRKDLADILNSYGRNSDDWDFGRPGKTLGIDFNPPLPFWDYTLRDVEQNWDVWAKDALNKYGFKIIN